MGAVIMNLGLGVLLTYVDKTKDIDKTTGIDAGYVDSLGGVMKTLGKDPTTKALKYYTVFTLAMTGFCFGSFLVNSGMHNNMPNIVNSYATQRWTGYDPIMSPFDIKPVDPEEMDLS